VDHGKDPTTGKDILVTLANGVEVQKRTLDAWTGGAILASLSTFAEMWMTRADFEEHGATRVLAGKSF
jgi:actin-related protein